MKASLLVLLATLIAAAPSAFARPVIGEPAPAFALTGADGSTHALSDYKGSIVVLEWSNPECPFVRKHYGAGNMQTQQQEATAHGVVWLTINSGAPGKQGHLDAAAANAWVAKVGGHQTAYLLDPDGVAGHAYDARTTPHLFVIDKDGVLRYMGGIDSIASADREDIAKATQYVPQAIGEIEAGTPVAVPTSEPYGCSVKYGSS